MPLYRQASAKAEAITTHYAISSLAGKLTFGETKIGPYSLAELTDRVIPQARVQVEAEASPLVCALLLASRKPLTTLFVGADARLDARPEVVAKIVAQYARAGQCERLLQVTTVIGVVLPKDWLLAAMVPKGAEIGQHDQALAAAMALADAYQAPPHAPGFAFTKADAFAEVAIRYAQAGQAEQAAKAMFQSLRVAHTVENDSILERISRKYAQAGSPSNS